MAYLYSKAKNPFKLRLFASVSLMGVVPLGSLHAQTSVGAAEAATDAQDMQDQDIVVTGSRVIRNGNESPSPVTVVQTQDVLQMRPGTLAEALNILPVFSGSKGTTSNPSTTGATVGGNGNANQLNLRNLGPNRTLILLDGYRVPPTSYNNVVDVDIIPQLLIQRVDTVTGGVSAVYGSDAVAGVVNYVLDKKFEGLRLQGNSGISQRGDNRKLDAGFAVGKSFLNDRGHIELSYQYIDMQGIPARSDRAFINRANMTGAGTTANPYVLGQDLRQSGFPFGGLITTGVLANRVFATDGVLQPFQAGLATGTSGVQIGGDGGYYDSTLAGKLRAHQVFGRFDYELSDNIAAYVQISGNNKLNQNYSDPLRLNGVTLSSSNPFLAAQYRTQLANAGQTTFRLSQLTGNNTRLESRSTSDQWVGWAGLDGKFGDWRWGVNYSHGRSVLDVTLNRNPDYQRLAAALDAVVGPGGQIVCNITVTNPTAPVGQGCSPYNPFGPTAASQASLDYILISSFYKATTDQDHVSGHIAGSPFSTWAGPINVAVSGEWRKLRFFADSSLKPSDLRNCTGLRFNCTSTQAISDFTFANTPRISQTVYEGAVEVELPLVRDVPFIQALNLNGAARYTHYDTSGNYWTWKIGGDWRVADTLRFRGTISRDIRAPTLFELFSPPVSIPGNVIDLLTGQTPSVPIVTAGNPNLTAEVGKTATVGFIWQPTSRLSLTVDAYSIKVSGAITTVSGNAPAQQNACYDSGGSSFFCSLQSRPLGYGRTAANMAAGNAVTEWRGTYLNYSEISTKGIDAEINYSTSLFGRPALARLMAAYQPHIYFVQAGAPTIDQGGAAFGPSGFNPSADTRISGFVRFQPFEGVSVDILERWRSAMKLSGDPSVVITDNHISPFATTSLTLTFDIKVGTGKAQLSFNVENLFDATPPIGGYLTNGTRAGLRDGFVPGDDVVGRAFNAGLRATF